MKPRLSIIIPALNEGKYIERTLRQFLPVKKRYNLQIIVSDGNSKDNTVKIAKKYADDIVVYKKKRRQRISEARNMGAKLAKGDILVFIDADIRICNIKNFIETAINKFQDKDLAAITVPNYVYPEEETFSDKFFHFILNFLANMSNKIGIGGGRGECQIVSRNFLKKAGGYNNKLVVAEDVDLFERLKKIGKVIYLPGIRVYESPRRFRKSGYLKTFSFYIINFIFMKLFKRSFSKEWKQVR